MTEILKRFVRNFETLAIFFDVIFTFFILSQMLIKCGFFRLSPTKKNVIVIFFKNRKTYKSYKSYNGELSYLTGTTAPPIITEQNPRKRISHKRENIFSRTNHNHRYEKGMPNSTRNNIGKL